jgi:hypothetical protein
MYNQSPHMYEKVDVESIPSLLDTYKLYDLKINVSLAYKIDKHVYSFVHFGDNLFSLEEFIPSLKDICSKKVNGIYTNYICFYSPMLPNCEFLNLEKEYHNFVYYHQPLIAFGQIPGHIDVELIQPIEMKHTKNYCCLINRSTPVRRQLFNFLQEKNLLESGYVSYRNVNRANVANNDHFLSKPYKNFKDIHYTDDQTDNPRQYVWYYPLQDFLFDFSIETFDEDVPFLTEKSTKAFFWGKIPVSTSSRNLMNYVEQFGFDIFRDIIDYNYDIQRDPKLRINLFLQQVYKLATMNINDIPDLRQRLKNNQELMCTLVTRSQTILSDINSNVGYINQNIDEFMQISTQFAHVLRKLNNK